METNFSKEALTKELEDAEIYIALRERKTLKRVKKSLKRNINKIKKNPLTDLNSSLKNLEKRINYDYSFIRYANYRLAVTHIPLNNKNIILISDYKIDLRSQALLFDLGEGLRDYMINYGNGEFLMAFVYEDRSGKFTYRAVKVSRDLKLYKAGVFHGKASGTVRSFRFNKIKALAVFSPHDYENLIIEHYE